MKKRKHSLSLLEIIIVIFLITLVTGALGYNMKGALDKGRAFRTEQGMQEVYDLLMLSVAEGKTLEEARKNPLECLKSLHLSKNPEKLLKDGWGEDYTIVYTPNQTDLVIHSNKYEKYLEKRKGSEDGQASEKASSSAA